MGKKNRVYVETEDTNGDRRIVVRKLILGSNPRMC